MVFRDKQPDGTVRLTGGIPKTGDPGIVVVSHGTNSTVDRPNATVVHWVGTSTPDNALPTDFWSRINI